MLFSLFQQKSHQTSTAITEFPKVVVQKKAGDKKNFIYDGEMAAEPIIQFIKDIEEGKIEANLKSEPVPETNDEPVKTVVGKNLQEVCFSEEKDDRLLAPRAGLVMRILLYMYVFAS